MTDPTRDALARLVAAVREYAHPTHSGITGVFDQCVAEECRAAQAALGAESAKLPDTIYADEQMWLACGHTASATCFQCYVDRGQRLAAVEAERDLYLEQRDEVKHTSDELRRRVAEQTVKRDALRLRNHRP